MRSGVEARVPGAVLVVVGLAFGLGAWSYEVVSGGRMGPGLMPLLAGSVLVVLGVVLGVVGVPRKAQPVERGEVHGADGPAQLHRFRPWVILGAAALALAAATTLGLLEALALMMFGLLFFVERTSWKVAVGVTLGTVGLSWVVFVYLLDVPVPPGVLVGG
ncbi:MAG: tripartite tricarboxylate transporter TctB family protein [Nocardioidaceae bacterium]